MFGGISIRTRASGWSRYLRVGCILFLAIPAWLGVSDADAQTIEWNNPAGGNWHDAVNWDPENVPNGAGEHALFPADGGEFGDGSERIVHARFSDRRESGRNHQNDQQRHLDVPGGCRIE